MKVHYADVVSNEGGWWYLLLDATLLVPLGMAVMFWPIPVIIGAAVASAVTFGLYRLMHRTHG
ncbi:MAG: hypothetical protein ABL993_01680 [Vicinamibacterales bacterium]